MQWLKTWLRKWLGVDAAVKSVSDLDADYTRVVNGHAKSLGEAHSQIETLKSEIVKVGVRIENLREHYATVKEMGDACMARLDRETMKLTTAINTNRDVCSEYAHRTDVCLTRLNSGLLDVVKFGERDARRISELETLIKDATLDTALAALEDRIAVIENHPAPNPAPQGRRGGSAWNSHQVAAAAGAALANGVPNPIPTPGIS